VLFVVRSALMKNNFPGIAFCVFLGSIAWIVAEIEESIIDRAVIDALVIALVLGILTKNLLPLPTTFGSGGKFASKQVLEASVLLLGASVALQDITSSGTSLLILILVAVFGGLTVAWFIGHKLLGLSSRLAVLVGVGNSICGNSAVAAVAPVIKATPNEVAAAIGISAILGVGQILILPFFAPIFDLDHVQYGILAGISVYAVPQVVAASFAVSPLSGQTGTLVKLVRVLLLGPMIIVLGLLHRDTDNSSSLTEKIKTYVPWFVAGFLILTVLRTTDVISEDIGLQARSISKLLFVVAMAGLGLGVDVREVGAVGPRVAVTILGTMCFMIVLALVGIQVLDLGLTS